MPFNRANPYTTIVAGDATVPATWLATLSGEANKQLGLDPADNAVAFRATGTAYTVYVAALVPVASVATWLYVGEVAVSARDEAILPVVHGKLAFGTVGGGSLAVASVNVNVLAGAVAVGEVAAMLAVLRKTNRQSATITCGANAQAAIIAAPAAGHQLWIYTLAFSLSVAGTVKFESANTAKTGVMTFVAGGGMGYPGIIKCATAEAFNVTTAGGAIIAGVCEYEDITL